jgi:hypothetical protein
MATVEMTGHAFGDKNVVSETQNADNAKGAMGKCDSDKQVPSGIAQGRVVMLVTYSDLKMVKWSRLRKQ